MEMKTVTRLIVLRELFNVDRPGKDKNHEELGCMPVAHAAGDSQ
jgi:hypothetical protein